METINDERLIKLDSHVSELLQAIQLCLDNDCVIPSMMLLFAATDGMAWLYRDHDGESTGKDFKEWVARFWIDQHGGITSAELWQGVAPFYTSKPATPEIQEVVKRVR